MTIVTAKERLHAFYRRSTMALVANGFVKGALRAWILSVIGLLLLQLLDRFVPLPGAALRALWFADAVAAAALFASAFHPVSQFSLRERSKQIHLRSTVFRVDDFRVAVELAGKENVPSSALRDLFTERMAERLEKTRASWSAPRWNWKPILAVALLCSTLAVGLRAALPLTFPFSNRFIFPFSGAEWRKSIVIEPGNARVAMGGSVNVRVRLNKDLFEAPELFVKSGHMWERRAGESDASGSYVYALNRIVVPVSYRVRWKNEWSERFTLTPVEPLAIRGWAVRLSPPAYTGQLPREQTAPEIRGLAGTRIELKVETNAALKAASLRFSDGKSAAARALEEKSVSFDFVLDRTVTYRIELSPVAETPRAEPDTYGITMVNDEAPQITMLSPEQDIVIGENEACPVTFEAKDDVALGRVDLAWQEQSGRTGTQPVKIYSSSLDRDLDTYEWKWAALGFRPGAVIRFRLEVFDKNTVTGPGKAVSEWRVVEIRSFEREHAAIEKLLEAWRDQAVAALAQTTTLQAKTENPPPDLTALSSDAQKLNAQLDALNNNMKNLVDRMEKDPLADYGVWMEHKQMQETLEHLAKNAGPSAQAALQTQNKNTAQRNLEEISNELERMTALSENLSKNQKAHDVLQSGDDLEKAGEELARALEDGKVTPEVRAKVNQLLDEANKQLAQMAHALQDMPQELPEDFVNQEGVKKLELGKTQDILEQINQAMAKGDAAQAMALAQRFLEMAKNMNKQLSKAQDSFTQAHSAEKIAEQIGEQSKELDKITERQSKLLDQTQRIASQQYARSMAAQADALAALAARQQAVVAKATELARDPAWPPPLAMTRFSVEAMLAPMREILAEMQSKRLVHTGEIMPALLTQLHTTDSIVAASSAPVAIIQRTHEVEQEETDLWNQLQKLSSNKTKPTGEEKTQSQSLRSEQSDLEQQTQQLRKKIQELSQKTASLGAPLMHSLGQAGGHMRDSSGALSDAQAPSAQKSQEQALDELRSAQDSLQKAQSMMSEMAMEQGGESGGQSGGGRGGMKVIARPGGSPGSQGTNNGKVRLPTAADYRPPKAFREDLLEALKERYPKTYEEIIRQYYKRLAN